MQRLEVSGAVRPIYGSLDVKRLIWLPTAIYFDAGNKRISFFVLIFILSCLMKLKGNFNFGMHNTK